MGATLHDPWARCHPHFTSDESLCLLDLLSTDCFIEQQNSSKTTEAALLQDLLSVDLEFHRATVRDHTNLETAPELQEQKNLFLNLLAVDQEMDKVGDSARRSQDQHFSSTKALHDPYSVEEKTFIQQYFGVYSAYVDGAKGSSHEEMLQDNSTMMELLSVDESVDDCVRFQRQNSSSAYSMILSLYDVDFEVGAAKRKFLLIADLQEMLGVDRHVDGKFVRTKDSGPEKRNIFSVKEKYKAKVASAHY